MREPKEYMSDATLEMLKRQHYALFGHSAAKLCHWAKQSLSKKRVCYKQKFYGISSHRCLQMTPAVPFCQQNCCFCWRPHTKDPLPKEWDSPEEIVEESIRRQRVLLSGYGALKEQIGEKKLEEAMNPNQVAISLAGEPTVYPRISELIDAYHAKGFSTFLVTNGLLPETLSSMTLPTQLYISVEATDKELHKRINHPQIPDSWERLMKTLELLPSLKTRKCVRITCVKGMNMGDEHAKGFAELLKIAKPDFVELKAYMFVGYSRQRLKEENMPLHAEVRVFAEKVNNYLGYNLVDESEPSRVVLLWNGETPLKIPK